MEIDKEKSKIKQAIRSIAKEVGMDIDSEEFKTISKNRTGKLYINNMNVKNLNKMLRYVQGEKMVKEGTDLVNQFLQDEELQKQRGKIGGEGAIQENTEDEALQSQKASIKMGEEFSDQFDKNGNKRGIVSFFRKLWFMSWSAIGFIIVIGFIVAVIYGAWSVGSSLLISIGIIASADTHNDSGYEYFEAGDYKSAIIEYSLTIAEYPDNYTAHYRRGTARFLLQDSTGAESDLNKAIAIDPGRGNAYYQRARLRNSTMRYKAAINDYIKAIEFTDLDVNQDYYNDRGIAKYNSLDYLGAIEDFTSAIKIYPDFASVYENRGITYFKLNKIDSACLDLSKAILIRKIFLTESILATELKKKLCSELP